MLKILESGPIPQWLALWRVDTPFVGSDVLNQSLFYPSSGFDYVPVISFGGYVHSFVYVDYGSPKEDVLDAFNRSFRGYRLLGQRELDPAELEGPEEWEQIMIDREIDGNPDYAFDYRKQAFAIWGVYELDTQDLRGKLPDRFSLLYFCAEGCAAYQYLYYSNHSCPKAVALVSPGEGFGHNWTNFFDSRRIFARCVRSNPAGMPEYLMTAGNGSAAGERVVKWQDYSNLIYSRKSRIGWIELWSNTSTTRDQKRSGAVS